MKNYLLILCSVTALFIALFVTGYSYTPFASLILIFFVSVCVTFASGPEKEKAPNYIASMLCGVVWGFLFLQLAGLLTAIGLNTSIVNLVSNFTLVFCATVTHLIILQKTWMNNVGFIFAGVIGMCFTGGQSIIGVALTLLCGIIVAIAAGTIANLITAPKKSES